MARNAPCAEAARQRVRIECIHRRSTFASIRNTDSESDAESDAITESVVVDESADSVVLERKMQPARGRFARSDLDRQMASTFPCPLESGPSSRFLGQPATGTRRVAGTTHTESGRR